MKKYLITGFTGFVSKYFIDFLEQNKIFSEILGLDIIEPQFAIKNYNYTKWNFVKLDLLNKDKLNNIVYQFNPDYIIHLAAYSSVAFSWKEPVISFLNNTNIFLNLIDVVRKLNIKCKILAIGSSEAYGNINKDDLPLKESNILNPVSPYAVARVSQELISKVYIDSYGLSIIMTRSFNHIGPGQRNIFVVPSFARQLVELSNSDNKGNIETGDVSIVRDFLDVRDVVNAYYLLLEKGKVGEIYNVCSGNGYSLREIIERMSGILNIEVQITQRKDLIRPNDNKIIIGSNDKLKKTTNWPVKYSIEQSLNDILNTYKN